MYLYSIIILEELYYFILLCRFLYKGNGITTLTTFEQESLFKNQIALENPITLVIRSMTTVYLTNWDKQVRKHTYNRHVMLYTCLCE